MWEKFKQGREACERWFCDDLTYTLMVILLVAVASFGLGRWSALEIANTTPERPILVPTAVEVPATTQAAAVVETANRAANTGSYVASVNGTKYHLPSCPGAQQMNDENKIFFATETQARSAGYTRAANCSF